MAGEDSYPSVLSQEAAVPPGLKIKSAAWTVVWGSMAVSALLKPIPVCYLACRYVNATGTNAG